MIYDLYLDITEMASSNETCSVVLPTHACWLVVLRIGVVKIKMKTTGDDSKEYDDNQKQDDDNDDKEMLAT